MGHPHAKWCDRLREVGGSWAVPGPLGWIKGLRQLTELSFGEVPGELLLLRASCSQGKSLYNIHYGNKLGKEEALPRVPHFRQEMEHKEHG